MIKLYLSMIHFAENPAESCNVVSHYKTTQQRKRKLFRDNDAKDEFSKNHYKKLLNRKIYIDNV